MLTKEDAQKQIQRCNKCGTCQFHCPTYRISRDENRVARGRNYLVRHYLQETEGDFLQDKDVVRSLDGCLLCEACTAGCPSGVKTADIVLYHRQELLKRRAFDRTLKEKIYRAIFAHRTIMPLMGWGAHLYQNFPGQPDFAGTRGYLTEYLDGKTLKGTWPPGRPVSLTSPRKVADYRIAFFVGCASNTFFRKAAEDAVMILSQLGEVTLLDNYCCGAPLLSLGDWEGFTQVAAKNAALLTKGKWDFVVSDCATCTSSLKKYDQLGVELACPPLDLVELLHKERQALGATLKPLEQPFTFHFPCHLVRGQNLKQSAKELLVDLFGSAYVPHEEEDSCCGGAGTYGVFNRGMSVQIVDRKFLQIAKTPARTVVTACPGCLMQLNWGANRFSSLHHPNKGSDSKDDQVTVVALADLITRQMTP